MQKTNNKHVINFCKWKGFIKKMKVYIIICNDKIAPFNRPVPELLIGNLSIRDHYTMCIASLGLDCEYKDSPSHIDDLRDHIVLNGDTFVTRTLLKEFIERSKNMTASTVCAVRKGNYTAKTIAASQNVLDKGDSLQYGLKYVRPSSKEKEEPVLFDLDESAQTLVFPEHMCVGGKYLAPYDTRMIVHIHHWANLWSANLIYILACLKEIEENNKIGLLLSAVTTMSLNKWKLLSKVNKFGKRCDIHHTAYIEGSFIGDDVTIGAHSVIRHSIIGNGTTLGNSVTVESSVISDKCVILNGHIMQSVLMPETFSVTHFLSASLVGERCFIGSGAVLTDFRFDHKNIILMKQGIKIDSASLFLGCCLGDDVYLGGSCTVAPGRELPSGTKISLGAGHIITKVPENGFHITI